MQFVGPGMPKIHAISISGVLFVCFFWHYKPNKPNEVPVFNAMSKIKFFWLKSLNNLRTPAKMPHMCVCVCTHRRPQLSTQLSTLLAWVGWGRGGGTLLMFLSTCLFRPGTPPIGGSARRRIREQTGNWGSTARSWMCVSSCWLYLLMVHQLSALITAECQQILCSVCFFSHVLRRTKITPEDTLNRAH